MRRRGRSSVMGTMARTAVIAGTATAVSGNVAARGAQNQAVAAANQQNMVDQAATQAAEQVAAQQAPVPTPPPATAEVAPAVDPIAKIRELGELHAQGLLTDEEFAAAKANLLGI